MVPTDIIISATGKCNLHCSICDIPVSSSRDTLSLSDFKKLIEQASSAGARNFVLSGGEPLLIKDVFEIISYAKRKGLNVSMPTNGTLVTEEIAGKLKAAGLRVANVSIDGPEEVHDAIRGKGNFRRALNGLRLLRKAGIETTIAMTITSKNYQYMSYVIELAIDYGATTVKFQPFSKEFLAEGRGTGDFIIKKEEMPQFSDEIRKAIKFADYCGININPKNYLRLMPDYFLGTLKVKSCLAPYKSFAIDNNGSIFACWQFREPVGNIKNQDFLKIWNSKKLEQMQNLAKEGKCPGCLMSCYDQVFESRKEKQIMVRKMGNLKSLIVNRIKQERARIFLKKNKTPATEKEKALNEIDEAKKMLKEELKRLK
jgi:MoaA/NifB/PqqE/SkfB family radical SAM enzyme